MRFRLEPSTTTRTDDGILPVAMARWAPSQFVSRSESLRSQLVISTNVELRRDGLPYANRREPTDKGVAVYFDFKVRSMCFACDRISDNIYAIAKTIEARRGIERWGSGSMVEQAFTGIVALSAPKSPYDILGLRVNASDEEIETAFSQKVKQAHPNAGGSAAAMAELNATRAKLKEQAA